MQTLYAYMTNYQKPLDTKSCVASLVDKSLYVLSYIVVGTMKCCLHVSGTA